ncbi:hypothetical protein P7C71_g1862, partial [Lecanoromycetidae sp. Uapishka_2]
MPLFNIKVHLTMGMNERYIESHWEEHPALAGLGHEALEKKLASEQTMQNDGNRRGPEDNALADSENRGGRESDVDNAGISYEEKDSAPCATRIKGNVSSTFFALVLLFEAAACRRY